MPDVSEMLSLSEYAEEIGVNPIVVRQKVLRGNLPGAVKVGHAWLVPKGTPYIDHRVKSGNYRDWRKTKKKSDPDPLSDS